MRGSGRVAGAGAQWVKDAKMIASPMPAIVALGAMLTSCAMSWDPNLAGDAVGDQEPVPEAVDAPMEVEAEGEGESIDEPAAEADALDSAETELSIECTPGQTEELGSCVNCGTSVRACDGTGHWGEPVCTNQGECEPGSVDFACCNCPIGTDSCACVPPDSTCQPWSSKRHTCDSVCHWGPFTACAREIVADPANPTPSNGQTGVSRQPDFSWSLPTPGAHDFYSNIYLWNCSERSDACLIGTGGRGDPTSPVVTLSFSEIRNPATGVPIASLDCNRQYWWTLTPGTTCANTHVTTVSWTFTTGCS